MIPESYRAEKKFSRWKKVFYRRTVEVVLFLSGFLFFGPLFHELGHFLVLEIYRCTYYTSFSFNWFSGLRGVFDLRCSLERPAQVFFYLSGYSFTLISGATSIILSRKKFRYRKIFLSLGTGILMSVLSSVTLKGDLHTVPGFEGIGDTGNLLVALAILFSVSLSIYGIEAMNSERQEGN